MTNDDVIRWAREAGVESYGPTPMYPAGYGEFIGRLEVFAALAYAAGAEAEREACAKKCETLFALNPVPQIGMGYAANCAAAIRARGNGGE